MLAIAGPVLAHVHLLTLLCALSQLGKRAAGEAAELGCRGVELLGMIGAAGLESGEPAVEAREFIRRQFCNSFSDFLDSHAPESSTFWPQRAAADGSDARLGHTCAGLVCSRE